MTSNQSLMNYGDQSLMNDDDDDFLIQMVHGVYKMKNVEDEQSVTLVGSYRLVDDILVDDIGDEHHLNDKMVWLHLEV